MKSEIQNRDNRTWFINHGVQALDLSKLHRCQAIAATTGKPCQRVARKGQKYCGIHSGRYQPGARPRNKNAQKTGFFSAKAKKERAEAKETIQTVSGLVKTVKSTFCL